jgi:hypothetical protein
VLARLAPLRAPHHDETIVDGPAARRRRHRRRIVLVVQLLLLALGSGGAVVVLTGAGSRGVAPGLLGAAAAVGVAEVLRRRLRPDEGAVRAARGVAVEASATPLDRCAEGEAPVELGMPFTGVWSARGAVRRDARRGPPTRCALPPARGAGAVLPSRPVGAPQQATAGDAPKEPVESPGPDDLDLTLEVLAALHAGPGDG